MNKFDESALDIILSDADVQVQEVAASVKADGNKLIKNGDMQVDRIYGELEGLIAVGSELLTYGKYSVENETEGALMGLGSLLNSVNGTIKEFTKIHSQNLKFQQQQMLEQQKHENKMELLKYKQELSSATADTDTTDMYAYSQEEVIKALNEELKNEDAKE